MKWIYVSFSIFLNYINSSSGSFIYDDDSIGLHIHQKIKSYEEGMKLLRQAEKILGRPAELSINPFTTEVCTKQISGIVGRA